MIFLRLCCVRMYAAFYLKCSYIGKMLTGRAYIFWGKIKVSEIRKVFDRRQK